MDDGFMKKMLSNMRCGICGKQYGPGRVSVLGRQKELWFLSVYCEACESHGLVAATIKEEKGLERISDLTPEEEAKLGQTYAVGIDDFLDMHNFLKEFDGDFLRLFPPTLDA